MDIGYREANPPGGYKYVLVLLDKFTTNIFVYGMHGTYGAGVEKALWKFPIDAVGIPCIIQCNFGPRFIGGKAVLLLYLHGCHV